MTAAFHSLLIGVFIFVFVRYARGNYPKWVVYTGILLKISTTFLLGYYYIAIETGGDTFAHFNSAANLISQSGNIIDWFNQGFLSSKPWYYGEGRDSFFIGLISPIVYFTGYNFWLASIYLSLIGFFITWCLVLSINRYHTKLKWPAFYAFAIFPSFIFWSSGIMKETIVNPSLALIFATILYFFKERRFSIYHSSLLAIAILIVVFIKFFLLVPILTSVVVAFLHSRLKALGNWKTGLIFVALLVTGFLMLPLLHPWLSFERLPQTIYENTEAYRDQAKITGLDPWIDLAPSYSSLLKNAPIALLNALYRPVWYGDSSWMLPMKLENIYLLFATVFSLAAYRKARLSFELSGLLCFIIATAIIIGITTTNFGTLLRYKSYYLPYLVLLVSILPFRYIAARFKGN